MPISGSPFNPNDEEALKRVINYPRRGIGDTTVDKIIVAADQHSITPFEVILDCCPVPGQDAACLKRFCYADPELSGDHQNTECL